MLQAPQWGIRLCWKWGDPRWAPFCHFYLLPQLMTCQQLALEVPGGCQLTGNRAGSMLWVGKAPLCLGLAAWDAALEKAGTSP